jgi:hypothetical protein
MEFEGEIDKWSLKVRCATDQDDLISKQIMRVRATIFYVLVPQTAVMIHLRIASLAYAVFWKHL